MFRDTQNKNKFIYFETCENILGRLIIEMLFKIYCILCLFKRYCLFFFYENTFRQQNNIFSKTYLKYITLVYTYSTYFIFVDNAFFKSIQVAKFVNDNLTVFISFSTDVASTIAYDNA